MINTPKFTLLARKLQKAIVTSLQSVAGIPIYDYVPEGSVFPYVAIGALSIVPYSLKTIAVVDITVQIDSWSSYDGFAESEDILDIILQQLTGTVLIVEGATIHNVGLERCDFSIEGSDVGIRRHGQIIMKWRLS